MPVCYVTLSETIQELSPDQRIKIRRIVAQGLDSKSRVLDENHVALRIIRSNRKDMLADVEVEVLAQVYVRRLFSRDKRANEISTGICNLLDVSCACWINLQFVGYSRVTQDGSQYYSDSNNKLLSKYQEIRGIATKEKETN